MPRTLKFEVFWYETLILEKSELRFPREHCHDNRHLTVAVAHASRGIGVVVAVAVGVAVAGALDGRSAVQRTVQVTGPPSSDGVIGAVYSE